MFKVLIAASVLALSATAASASPDVYVAAGPLEQREDAINFHQSVRRAASSICKGTTSLSAAECRRVQYNAAIEQLSPKQRTNLAKHIPQAGK